VWVLPMRKKPKLRAISTIVTTTPALRPMRGSGRIRPVLAAVRVALLTAVLTAVGAGVLAPILAPVARRVLTATLAAVLTTILAAILTTVLAAASVRNIVIPVRRPALHSGSLVDLGSPLLALRLMSSALGFIRENAQMVDVVFAGSLMMTRSLVMTRFLVMPGSLEMTSFLMMTISFMTTYSLLMTYSLVMVLMLGMFGAGHRG